MSTLLLLIDDEVVANRAYVEVLHAAGYEVEQRQDPDEAWSYLESHGSAIALVILDIMMKAGERYKGKPTRSGIDTGLFCLNELRGSYPNLPIIVLTNVANKDTLARVPETAQVHLEQKPKCQPSRLVGVVRRLLSDAGKEGGA